MSEICVIINPSAGRKRAARRIEAFRQRWSAKADFWQTQSAGHASDLARQAVDRGYRIIAAAGGDGTVHEVVNGLLSAAPQNVTFAVVPVGSANDYATSVENQFGVAELDDESSALVDVGLLRTPDGREHRFVESVGIGLTGQITVAAQQIPGRQGLWLYGTAALRVLRRRQPALPLRLTWDDEPPQRVPTRLLSVLIGRREGAFLMARQALLDDGLFDVVHGGDVGHWGALRLLPRFLMSGPPADHPLITLKCCRRLKVESPEPLAIHHDGELFSTDKDNVHEVDIEMLPSLLSVKVCRA